MLRPTTALFVLLVLSAACAADRAPGDVAAGTSRVDTTVVAGTPSQTEPPPGVPPELAAYRLGTVRLDGVEMPVAIADDFGLRARGLMYVEDLESLAGMVFVWTDDSDSTFWMRNTVIPLDIAWFDARGRFVSETTMVPCPDDEVCPEYAAGGAYRYALEVRAGDMPELGSTSLLELLEGF